MENQTSGNLIDTTWLSLNLDRDDIRIIDATWYMPGSAENAYNQFQNEHIPGATFFDIDAVSDEKFDLPHMLPSEDKFSSTVGAMGITNNSHVIVYDRLGIFSSPRVWWTFKIMGHEQVSVLNGGLKKWISEGLPLHGGEIKKQANTTYTAKKRPSLVATFEEVLDCITAKDNSLILDARPNDRFTGIAEEPRPGLKKGHMPGAKNLFFGDLINPDGTIKSIEQLSKILEEQGITIDYRIVTTCGSGITASTLFFALTLLGAQNLSVYDGSWAEWGAREGAIIETL